MVLAKKSEIASDSQYPDGITFGETKMLPTPPETQQLKATIDALPPEVARDLSALMYLGRDGLENQTVKEAVDWLRDDAAKRPDADNKHSLRKVPLGDYLEQGKKLL